MRFALLALRRIEVAKWRSHGLWACVSGSRRIYSLHSQDCLQENPPSQTADLMPDLSALLLSDGRMPHALFCTWSGVRESTSSSQ